MLTGATFAMFLPVSSGAASLRNAYPPGDRADLFCLNGRLHHLPGGPQQVDDDCTPARFCADARRRASLQRQWQHRATTIDGGA
jgi:hypothetical protein